MLEKAKGDSMFIYFSLERVWGGGEVAKSEFKR